MSRPQQPEIARSGRTDVDPDHAAESLDAKRTPRSKGRTGPVPPENQPGHHPPDEQDRPDLDAFAARLTAEENTSAEAGGDQAPAAPDRPARDAPAPGPTEPVHVRCALYPVRLVAHVVAWSRDYFRRD